MLNGQQDISWAEAITFKCLVQYLLDSETQRQNFTVYGDNRGVVEGWWNGQSCNRDINNIFKQLYEHLQQSATKSSCHTAYVRTTSNPADTPSRGIYPPAPLLLQLIPLPSELEQFIIDLQLPFTPARYWSCEEGLYSDAAARWFNNTHQGDSSFMKWCDSYCDSQHNSYAFRTTPPFIKIWPTSADHGVKLLHTSKTGLIPLLSTLWPHCRAQDRLHLWCPLSSHLDNKGNMDVSDLDMEWILDMINVSLVKGTREVYGMGLLVYHVFCDSWNIPELGTFSMDCPGEWIIYKWKLL